jgi:hypothetical protein
MLLAVRYGAIEKPPQLTTACTLAAGKLDRLDGRVRLFDVFTAPATGKATALLVLRDGLTGVFNHHHDAPQKTCSYTEEANVNRLVNCSRRSLWLVPARPRLSNLASTVLESNSQPGRQDSNLCISNWCPSGFRAVVPCGEGRS